MNGYIGNLWDLVFGQQDLIGLTVNIIIFVLFLIGLIDVFWSWIRLRRERKLIEKADRELANSELANEGSRYPSGRAEKVLESLGIESEDGLLGKRVKRVIQLRSAGLGHRDVLQQLTVERIDGYGALARYIGVTLTLLGLLGTVFGLSQALFSIQGALGGVKDIEGFSQLILALSKTLEGMKTAFGCTLAGLFTAILLSAFNYFIRRKQSVVTARLEEFVVCGLLPALEKEVPNPDNAANAFANVISSATTDLNEIRKTITDAASRYQQGSEEVGKIATTLQGAASAFSDGAVKVNNYQEQYTQTLSDTRAAIGNLNSTIAKQLEEVSNFTNTTTQALNSRLSTISQTADDNRAALESIQTLAQKFQPAIEGYHNHFKGALDGIFGELKTSMNSLFVEVGKNYKDGVAGQIQKNQQSFEDALKQQTKDLQDLVEQNRKVVLALIEHNRKAVEESTKQNQAGVQAISDMVVDVNLRMLSLFEKLDGSGNGLGAVSSKTMM